MKIVALDGHPGHNAFSSALLDRYCSGITHSDAELTRFNLRDMDFDPVLHEGYNKRQDWEPDLEAAINAIIDCDHFVLSFPMWWGSQPAILKGFFDRAFLPGVAFKYRENSPLWDRLITGKSADVIITADTPKPFLHLMYGAPILKQIRKQVLDFCGFKPVRVKYFAPIRKQKEGTLEKWLANAEAFAASKLG